MKHPEPGPQPHEKRSRKWWWILGFTVVIVFGIPSGLLLGLMYSPAYAAQMADTVLRPVLGDQRTIALEGKILGLEDMVNHVRYTAPPVADYQPGISLRPVTPVPSQSATQEVQPSKLASPTVQPSPVLLPTITPIYDAASLLPREDVWQSIPQTDLYTTFVRTDSTRPYAVVNLVYIPISRVHIAAVAGTLHPGGELHIPGPGKIPTSIQASNTLEAAFNGGFQEKDGHYGMVVGNVTYVPLRKNLATLFIYTDGHVAMQAYDGTPLDPTVASARQDGLFLVQNGKDTSYTSAGIDLWAGTANGDYITWRSGLGITANGDLIYAVGPSLTPQALADALRIAGSVNAMQLDVNTYWVRFVVYQLKSNGGYTANSLIPALANGGQDYLNGYQKDFFYLYKRES